MGVHHKRKQNIPNEIANTNIRHMNRPIILIIGVISNENTEEDKPHATNTNPTILTPYGHDTYDLDKSTTEKVDAKAKNARNGIMSHVFK